MGGAKKLYANQRHISYQSVPRNKNNPYNTYNRSALQTALHELSSSAFKLYIYFGNYRDIEGGIYLSKQDALNFTKLSERSYFDAIKELKEKGYLLHDDWSSDDDYIFYETP